MKYTYDSIVEKDGHSLVRDAIDDICNSCCSLTADVPKDFSFLRCEPISVDNQTFTFVIPSHVLEWCAPQLLIAADERPGPWTLRWLTKTTELVDIDSSLCKLIAKPSCSYRGALFWLQPLPLLRGCDDLVQHSDEERFEIVFENPLTAKTSVYLGLRVRSALQKEPQMPVDRRATEDRVFWTHQSFLLDIADEDVALPFNFIGNCFLIHDPSETLSSVAIYERITHNYAIIDGEIRPLSRPYRTEDRLLIDASAQEIQVYSGWYALPVSAALKPQDAVGRYNTDRNETIDLSRVDWRMRLKTSTDEKFIAARVYWQHCNILKITEEGGNKELLFYK